MMEAKILTNDELPEAVKLAQGVFHYCLQNTVQFPETITYFWDYVNEKNVRALVEQGRLVLWGCYNGNQLVAMSGMQSEGHIVMLYVLPVFQRRGYGKTLLHAMRVYARGRYDLERVTVNAMPSWTAQYFSRRGFEVTIAQTNLVPFVPMAARSIREVRYEKKTIPTKWLIGTTVGGLAVCIAIAVIYMVSYFF